MYKRAGLQIEHNDATTILYELITDFNHLDALKSWLSIYYVSIDEEESAGNNLSQLSEICSDEENVSIEFNQITAKDMISGQAQDHAEKVFNYKRINY